MRYRLIIPQTLWFEACLYLEQNYIQHLHDYSYSSGSDTVVIDFYREGQRAQFKQHYSQYLFAESTVD